MIRPLNDRVVCQRVEAKKTTSCGIILPDVSQTKSRQANVLAVGPGRLLEDGSRSQMEVKVGDVVILGAFAGHDVVVGSDELVIVSESELLGVVS